MGRLLHGRRAGGQQQPHRVKKIKNNNNKNNYDNVYGAVIVTKVIARVHPVHLMNVD